MRTFVPKTFLILALGVAAVLSAGRVIGQGTLLEPLEGFFAPAGAVFSADGRTLFVTNSARVDYGMMVGRGAVSRVTVGEDGTLSMDRQKFTEGLSGPLGITVLPASLGEFPAGTLAVAVGNRWVAKDRANRITDPRERETGLVFLDPHTGARLGSAYLGAGSPIEAALGQPVSDPSHIVFDPAGNAYLTDVAGFGLKPLPGEINRPGIVRLSAAALLAIVRGEAPEASQVSFLDVPEVPGGIAFWPKNSMLYWATGPGYGDLAGAVLRLPGGDFGPSGSIDTVFKETQPMVGACLTPDGSLIVAHNNGDIGVLKGGRGKVKTVKFRRPTVFLSPGQPAATTLTDGRVLVVVPEMASSGQPAWRHRLQRFTLPSGY